MLMTQDPFTFTPSQGSGCSFWLSLQMVTAPWRLPLQQHCNVCLWHRAPNLTQFLSSASPPPAHCVSRRQHCSTAITDKMLKSFCHISALQTWTSRCLMKFYASVAASVISPKGNETVERIEKRVLDSNPVMEAFGKCGFFSSKLK